MMSNNNYELPSAKVVRSLLQHAHELSIYADNMPTPLIAEASELDLSTGRLVLDAEYAGVNIDAYLTRGNISIDIETVKGHHAFEREAYGLDNITAKILKTDCTNYQFECQLPESIFVIDDRGAMRIPFILGMHARVSLEVYTHELTITGRVRNLSMGGCLIDIDLSDSISLSVNQKIPGITLEFPNGESFYAEGAIRHIRPFGHHGYAAIGLQFICLSPAQSEAIFKYVTESEHEAAYRTGVNEKMDYHSALFIPGAKGKKILQREAYESGKRSRQTPMEKGVIDVAHQLQIGYMYIKTHEAFPSSVFYDCVDTLLYLVRQDRKALLYALSYLRSESEWVRHAVQVACQLADMMLARDPYDPKVCEAMLGSLLHTMGKPLLISTQLPSLKINMSPPQKAILKGHVNALLGKLEMIGWVPSPVCQDVIENANERLDGSGYPHNKWEGELSEVIRLVMVIKAINILINGRNGMPARAPLDAYRIIYDADMSYDKTVVVEYIKVYGLYPIGSLVKFSGGFLAWIMDIDGKGMPAQVQVVKNLRFPDANINTAMNKQDMLQIGKLEGVVNPNDYGMPAVKA
ncbi:PilZ domain-containing protein [Halomonas sp. SIMBA_159]